MDTFLPRFLGCALFGRADFCTLNQTYRLYHTPYDAYLTLISCISSFSSSISASFAACSNASSSSLNSLDSIIVTSLVRPRTASSARGEAVGVTSVNSPSESFLIILVQVHSSSGCPITGLLTRFFRFNHLCCIYFRYRTFYLYFLLNWI